MEAWPGQVKEQVAGRSRGWRPEWSSQNHLEGTPAPSMDGETVEGSGVSEPTECHICCTGLTTGCAIPWILMPSSLLGKGSRVSASIGDKTRATAHGDLGQVSSFSMSPFFWNQMRGHWTGISGVSPPTAPPGHRWSSQVPSRTQGDDISGLKQEAEWDGDGD